MRYGTHRIQSRSATRGSGQFERNRNRVEDRFAGLNAKTAHRGSGRKSGEKRVKLAAHR